MLPNPFTIMGKDLMLRYFLLNMFRWKSILKIRFLVTLTSDSLLSKPTAEFGPRVMGLIEKH